MAWPGGMARLGKVIPRRPSLPGPTVVLLLLLVTLLSVCIAIMVARNMSKCKDCKDCKKCEDCEVCDNVKTQVVVAQPARIAIDQNAGFSAPGTYPQLGYLRPAQGSAPVLPVYGRPSVSRNGRGFYYTIIPGSGIKVPLHTPGGTGRDCMEDVGCEALMSGDTVTVPDAEGSTWTVVLYKYNRT